MTYPDIGDIVRERYSKTLESAKAAEKKGANEEAASKYESAAMLMQQYADFPCPPDEKKRRLEQVLKLRRRSKELLHGYSSKPLVDSQKGIRDDTHQGSKEIEEDFESEFSNLITKTDVTWDDIGGLESTKRQIKTAYVMALAKPPLGQHYAALNRILFFGPPGTGKTTMAAAVAGELKSTFFQVNSHDLISKYVGESSKQIAALYALAQKKAPSIVYIDEIDAMVPQPGSVDNNAAQLVVNTFKTILDGMGKYIHKELVLTIAATNYPWQMDKAIASRFRGMTIYIPLPDEEARKAIFDIHLSKKGQKTAYGIDKLVSRTDNYSGREIEMVCQQAIRSMLDRANPGMENLADKGIDYIRNYQLVAKELNEADFDSAFENVKPVATPAMLKNYDIWMQSLNNTGSGKGG